MIPISKETELFLNQRGQEWVAKVEIDGVEYGMDSIVDFDIQNDVAPSDEFAIGTAVFSKLTLTLRRVYDDIPNNAQVVPYIGLLADSLTWDSADIAWDDANLAWEGGMTEWIPLGVFYINNRERVHDILVLDCYDGLVYADIQYVSELDYPATMQQVWDEVCAQSGLIYDSSVQIDPHVLNAAPTGFTCRQVMSYIAGVHGASVKMSRTGAVSWRKYAASETPVYELGESDYMRVRQLNPPKKYTRLVVIYDEDEQLAYEAGEGDENHTLYMTNPLMTQEMTDALLQQISGFAYVPIEMDCRGYPHLEHGDRITFVKSESFPWDDADLAWEDADIAWDGTETYHTLILRQTFSFKGGLNMSLSAPSISEQESEFGIDGSLTAAIKRLNENALKYDKPYYGVTHSRNEGIVVQREDGLAKAVFNADELSFYANGDRALWFDIQNRRFVFGGHLEAASGTFTGSLEGGSITIGSGNNVFRADTQGIWAGNGNFSNAPFRVNMQGQLVANNAQISGSITSSTITGGTIIGAGIIGGYITTFSSSPRIMLSSDENVLSVETSSNNRLRIAPFLDGPALLWNAGSSQGRIQLQSTVLAINSSVNVGVTADGAITIISDQMISLSAPLVVVNGTPISQQQQQ